MGTKQQAKRGLSRLYEKKDYRFTIKYVIKNEIILCNNKLQCTTILLIVRWYYGRCELCELQQQTAPGAVAPDIPANSQGQRLERCLQPLMHSGRPAVWRPGIQRLQIQCTPHLSIVKLTFFVEK